MNSETSTESQAFRPWELFTLAALIGGIVVVLMGRGAPRVETIFLGFTVFAAGALGVAVWRSFAPLTNLLSVVSSRIGNGRSKLALEREKMLALRALKELEFDRAMNKVSMKDYGEMSGRLRGRATRLLRQLDSRTIYETEIKKEIDSRFNSKSIGSQETIRSAACLACGTKNDTDARFCKSCGVSLEGR
jgi:ribosomal protein L40E